MSRRVYRSGGGGIHMTRMSRPLEGVLFVSNRSVHLTRPSWRGRQTRKSSSPRNCWKLSYLIAKRLNRRREHVHPHHIDRLESQQAGLHRFARGPPVPPPPPPAHFLLTLPLTFP